MAGTLVIFPLMLTTLAMIGALSLAQEKRGGSTGRATFILLALVGYFLMFWTTRGSPGKAGRSPLSPFYFR